MIPNVGTLTYNGVVFDAASQVVAQIEYVQDEATRTVIYQRIVLTVRAIVASSDGTDSTLDTIRTALCEQGKQLKCINRGFGTNINVNGTGDVTDCKFGPKPKILHWEPIGSNKACEIEWQVETCIPCCVPSTTTPIIALNYAVAYTIDEKGFVTRTISGYYEIAMTRNDRAIPFTSDQFRTQIAPDIPSAAGITYSTWTWEGAAFKRQSSWQTSLDKSREDFTIIDRQIQSNHAYPDYAVHARGRHRGTWRRPRKGSGGSVIRHNISMELELADGISPALSFLIFSNIVKTRIDAANKNYVSSGTKKKVIIEELTIEEDLFGRVSSFFIEYRILGTIELEFLGTNSGFWTKFGNLTSWSSWKASMQKVFSQYGPLGIKTLPANDGIIDACEKPELSTAANGDLNLPTSPTLTAIYPKNYKPDPDTSYGKFKQVVVPKSESPVVLHSPLQQPITDSQATTLGGDMLATTGFSMAIPNTTAGTVQQGGAQRHSVMVAGYAERYGYEIPRPAFSQLGTEAGVKEQSLTFSQAIIANVLGVPLYRAEWYGVYLLPNSPTNIHPPANYDQGVNSDGTIMS